VIANSSRDEFPQLITVFTAGTTERVMPIDRLLIRAPNWMGDVVLSLPAVRDLRHNFPSARIEVLARPGLADLYRAVGEVDAVGTTGGFRNDVRTIRSGKYDAVAVLPNSFGTALQAFMAGVPQRWGYATDGRGPLLTRGARVPAEVRGGSEVYYYRAMLAGVGLQVTASPDATLRCPPEWSARGAVLLDDDGDGAGGPWVGFSPGASFGSAKRWIPQRYSAVGDLLCRRQGARIAILGGPDERPLAEEVAAGMRAPARNLCGQTTTAELVGVLKHLRLLVTGDSGPMHVAAALGVPVVAVFGPTDWRETAPRGDRHRLVREPVHCSPCKLRECPIDHRCMTRITADRVLDEACGLLETTARGGTVGGAADDAHA
jgi:heptosyltransferase-2